MVDGPIMNKQINLNDLQVSRQFEGEQISRLKSFWIKKHYFKIGKLIFNKGLRFLEHNFDLKHFV
jgi:hypothetical protein